MNIMNCFSMENTSGRYCRYGFFDTRDHLAQSLFAKYGIRVRCERELWNRENDYTLVVCSVLAWQRTDFLMAMAELPEWVARSGRGDYIRFCNKYLDWSEEWLAEQRAAA